MLLLIVVSMIVIAPNASSLPESVIMRGEIKVVIVIIFIVFSKDFFEVNVGIVILEVIGTVTKTNAANANANTNSAQTSRRRGGFLEHGRDSHHCVIVILRGRV